MVGPRPVVIIGEPSSRRVTGFQAALAAAGWPAPSVVPWRDLIVPGAAFRRLTDWPTGTIVRIESTDSDPALERALLRRGFPAAEREGAPSIAPDVLRKIPFEMGRILAPRQAHLGFLAVLQEIDAALRADWTVLQPVSAIAELFDKRRTSRRWRHAGIPVPESIDDVRDPDALREQMRARQWRAVFVKVACASAASCLAVFSHHADGEYALSTVEDTGEARYNTRRLQRLSDRRAIDRVLRFLLAEGAQVELAIGKPRIDGGYFDLRVLMIDGEPAFVVVRVSRHPITNLHLGGRRGDLAAVRRRVPEAAWADAMNSARAVHKSTQTFHLGVDLMFEPSLTRHRIIEGNAFGDLLPNLERDGVDVYGWQIRRLSRRA